MSTDETTDDGGSMRIVQYGNARFTLMPKKQRQQVVVENIVTVPGDSGEVDQIFTVTKRTLVRETDSYQPSDVSRRAVSILKPVRTIKTTPLVIKSIPPRKVVLKKVGILRKAFAASRPMKYSKVYTTQENKKQIIIKPPEERVAGLRLEPILPEVEVKTEDDLNLDIHFEDNNSKTSMEMLPLEPEIDIRIKEEPVELTDIKTGSSTPERESLQLESDIFHIEAGPSNMDFELPQIDSIRPSTLGNPIFSEIDSTPADYHPVESQVEHEPPQVEGTDLTSRPMCDNSREQETLDALQSVAKLLHSDSKKCFLVSYSSLMQLVSRCETCSLAVQPVIISRGIGCSVRRSCSRGHVKYWHSDGITPEDEKPSKLDRDSLMPNIHWNFAFACLLANVMKIPSKKLALLFRLLFSGRDVFEQTDVAYSVTSSFPLLYQLCGRHCFLNAMDTVKAIVICKKIVVFLDPRSNKPLACVDVPRISSWTVRNISMMLKISLERLQMLGIRTIRNIRFLPPNCMRNSTGCWWSPIRLINTQGLHAAAVVALNNVTLSKELTSMGLRNCLGPNLTQLILEDIITVLLFYQPIITSLPEDEGRTLTTSILKQLTKLSQPNYMPTFSDLIAIKDKLTVLCEAKYSTQITTFIHVFARHDIYEAMRSIENDFKALQSTYISVSIEATTRTKGNERAMHMIDVLANEEYTVQNAFSVLTLLPLVNSPCDFFDEVVKHFV